MKPKHTNAENIDLLVYKVDEIKSDVSDIKKSMEANYATKEWCEANYGATKRQFAWMLMIFGGAVITAFATFVIKGGLK